jgi:hypothetical protein
VTKDMQKIRDMVENMEVVESILGRKGRFVGDMVHISIVDLAECIRKALQQKPAVLEGDLLTWMEKFLSENGQSNPASVAEVILSKVKAALSSGAGVENSGQCGRAAERVVRAAISVVNADTYFHPMLSREDAVKAGVAELHDAVNNYRSSQMASIGLSA